MVSYWTHNSFTFLILLSIFPRVGLLFCNISLSFLFWIGWLFLPRITIAIFATYYYASTNPILVIISWFIALSGETAEKKYGYKMKTKVSKKESRETEFEIIE